jgi:hypothetical protein
MSFPVQRKKNLPTTDTLANIINLVGDIVVGQQASNALGRSLQLIRRQQWQNDTLEGSHDWRQGEVLSTRLTKKTKNR